MPAGESTRSPFVRTAIAALFLVTVSVTQARVFDAIDHGSYYDDGSHTASNRKTYTGRYRKNLPPYDFEYYDAFLLFDLSSLEDRISEATLRIHIEKFYSSLGESWQTFRVYEVTNAASVVTNTHSAGNAEGLAVYEDLRSGTFFGEARVCPEDVGGTVDVALNQSAVSAINAAAGTPLLLGLELNTSSSFEWNQYLRFWYADGDGPIQLIVGDSPQPPSFAGLVQAPDAVTLSITNLTPGATCRLERCSALHTPAWSNAATFVPSTTWTNVTDNVPPRVEQVFYRLRVP